MRRWTAMSFKGSVSHGRCRDDADTPQSRWALSKALHPRRGQRRTRLSLRRVDAPNLTTVKDFLRFHIATSRGKIVEKPTVDSVNTFAEWYFAGFSRITGTPTDKEDRSEVYKVNTLP